MKQTVSPIQSKKRFACAVCLCTLFLCAAVYSAGNIDNSRAGAKSPLADAKTWEPADYYESADFQSAADAEKSVHAYAGAGVIPVSR